MKSLWYWVISGIFIALIIFNATYLDFSNLFSDESFIALISILATLCAFILLWLLFLSRKIMNSK